jgi:c-di-GMP-binding flagellar brake protein YcgR
MVMKRRNRKQSSKAASPPKIPANAEKPASLSGISSDAEDLVSSLSIAIDEEHLAVALDITSEAEQLTGSPNVTEDVESILSSPRIPTGVENSATSPNVTGDTKNPAGPTVASSGADRRIHPRYEFTAAVEVRAAESGTRIETRVRDLSQQGCYVDTSDALPLGTVTDVRIKKGAQLFEARARVVYSRATKGMGLVFTAIEPERLHILETWLAESRETSWLAANRRRSQRVLMTIPVRVSGQLGAGLPFEEDAHTRAISAHGALILVSAQVHRGQRLTLSNVQTKAALECVVAHIDRHHRDHPQVGVEFMLPNPMFWHVAFPPKDWTPRHPDAKSHIKAPESS